MAAPQYLTTVGHLVLMSLLLFGTSLYMLVTISNRMRVRRVLLSWRSRWICGNSSIPLAFTVLVVATLGWAWLNNWQIHPVLSAGYLASGIFWSIGALLQQLIVVSDYGILRDVNRVEGAVAWGQVVDYFVKREGGTQRYVFFYLDDEGERRRTSLRIPPARRKAFKEVVERKLDARFNFAVERMYGREAFDS
jgi:hypothetical protein